MAGRIGLLHHEKALVITPTLFSQEDYEADWQEPMRRIIDEWGLRYPGVEAVEHVYFYRAAVADEATIRGYLERSYELGKETSRPAPETSRARRPRTELLAMDDARRLAATVVPASTDGNDATGRARRG